MGEVVVIRGTISSQQILCCNARSWARFIGWLQIWVGAVSLLVCFILCILLLVALGSRGGDDSPSKKSGVTQIIIAMSILLIGICILCLAAGIVLVRGISEENPSKLKCWLIIQGIFFGLTKLQMILQLVAGTYVMLTEYLVSIPINIFFIWVVNLHRQELLSASRSRPSL